MSTWNNNITLGGALALAIAVFLSVAVSATPYTPPESLLKNGSFEKAVAIDPWGFTVLTAPDEAGIDGWKVESGSVDLKGGYVVAADGLNSVDLTGYNEGSISQAFPTVVGQEYKVKFYMAGNTAGEPMVKTMKADVGGEPETFSFDATGKTLLDMGWEKKHFVFTATADTTTLTFTSTVPDYFGPVIDKVTVRPVVTDKKKCMHDGWKSYSEQNFRNQGDCVSRVDQDQREE